VPPRGVDGRDSAEVRERRDTVKHYRVIVTVLVAALVIMLTMAVVTLVNGPVAPSRPALQSQPVDLGGAGQAAPLPNAVPSATPTAGAWL
jgi:hypothetical protein